MRYDFEWDPAKAQTNLAKHGVPFELALSIFADPLTVTKPDPRYDDRWISTGEVKGTLLVVVHTDVESTTDEGQVHTRVRIISARIADPAERRAYRDER
jgi:uncharacterized DUF497 family protein